MTERDAAVISPLAEAAPLAAMQTPAAAYAPPSRVAAAPVAQRGPRSLRLLVFLVLSLLIGAPLVAVVAEGFAAPDGLWGHLLRTVFWSYVANTLLLCLGVGTITTITGTGVAWLVTMFRFPGQRIFDWAMVLPLAMPAYVLAYAYTDLLQFTGPVQSLLRHLTGLRYGEYWFPQIHSAGGAMFVLGFALYPYVYLLARAAFTEQSACALEVSRTLGCSLGSAFWRVALPVARPAIATGLSFALMETLADFGAVKYFEVPTYTTGIYRAWYATANPTVAAQLASALLLFVFVVFAIERLSRKAGRFRHTTSRYRALGRERLRGLASGGAMLACLLPLAIGFVVPAVALISMAVHSGDDLLSAARLGELLRNSVLLAALASGMIVGCAIIALYALRGGRDLVARLGALVCSIGYATPGVVIAIGILIAVGAFDRLVASGLREAFGIAPGMLLGGSLAAVVYGCLVRFFAVAYGPLEAAMAKIKPSYEDAARLLRGKATSVLRHVHLPLMRSSLVIAALIVFVDVMKELPATMILRPFNFDTLAVEAFQLATTERLDAAAVPSLVIVAAGLLPVIILCREVRRSRPGQRH